MKFFTRKLVVILLAACISDAANAAEAYPQRPVRIIVPVAPGGSIDAIGRILADYLPKQLGGAFIVDNKVGANTMIGSSYVSTAAPDGYTLLLNSDALVTVSLSNTSGTTVDPVKGLRPVSMVVSSPAVLVVKPDLGAKTLEEFMALAKTRSLNVASTGAGTASQFTGMMFRQKAGLTWTDIPYNGSAPALTALLGGHVDAMWSMAAPLLPSIKEGKIIALGITSTARSAELPSVPTIASVLAGFEVNNWTGLFAPPGTPKSVVDILSAALSKMSKDPVYASRLSTLGFVPIGSDAAALEAEIKSSLARWNSVLGKWK